MKTPTILLLSAFFAFAPAAVAASPPSHGWVIAKSGTANGQFAVKSVHADIPAPHGLAVRLSGQVVAGTAVVSCTAGTGVASWHRGYRHAGTFTLPMTPNSETCTVIAAVSGGGRVHVGILTR